MKKRLENLKDNDNNIEREKVWIEDYIKEKGINFEIVQDLKSEMEKRERIQFSGAARGFRFACISIMAYKHELTDPNFPLEKLKRIGKASAPICRARIKQINTRKILQKNLDEIRNKNNNNSNLLSPPGQQQQQININRGILIDSITPQKKRKRRKRRNLNNNNNNSSKENNISSHRSRIKKKKKKKKSSNKTFNNLSSSLQNQQKSFLPPLPNINNNNNNENENNNFKKSRKRKRSLYLTNLQTPSQYKRELDLLQPLKKKRKIEEKTKKKRKIEMFNLKDFIDRSSSTNNNNNNNEVIRFDYNIKELKNLLSTKEIELRSYSISFLGGGYLNSENRPVKNRIKNTLNFNNNSSNKNKIKNKNLLCFARKNKDDPSGKVIQYRTFLKIRLNRPKVGEGYGKKGRLDKIDRTLKINLNYIQTRIFDFESSVNLSSSSGNGIGDDQILIFGWANFYPGNRWRLPETSVEFKDEVLRKFYSDRKYTVLLTQQTDGDDEDEDVEAVTVTSTPRSTFNNLEDIFQECL